MAHEFLLPVFAGQLELEKAGSVLAEEAQVPFTLTEQSTGH